MKAPWLADRVCHDQTGHETRREIAALAHPKSWLAFFVASVLDIALGKIEGAMRAEYGDEAIKPISTCDMADETAGTQPGMMIASPEEEWTVLLGLVPMAMGQVLRELSGKVELSASREQRRGPRQPALSREGEAKETHASTKSSYETAGNSHEFTFKTFFSASRML